MAYLISLEDFTVDEEERLMERARSFKLAISIDYVDGIL